MALLVTFVSRVILASPVTNNKAQEPAKKVHIVLFRANVATDDIHSHYSFLQTHFGSRRPNSTASSRHLLEDVNNFNEDIHGMVHQYFVEGFKGYAMNMSESEVEMIKVQSLC